MGYDQRRAGAGKICIGRSGGKVSSFEASAPVASVTVTQRLTIRYVDGDRQNVCQVEVPSTASGRLRHEDRIFYDCAVCEEADNGPPVCR